MQEWLVGMPMYMFVLAMGRVLMPTTIFDFNLNRTMANLEIMFQHMRNILMNVLTITYALICHDDVTTARNQS